MPIYARTSGDVYKTVSRILTADGNEIGKVVDSTGRIIYEASRLITVTGVPPISFTKSIGKSLVSWDLLGNAQQTGTPSPDNIIMPEFCGVRTEQIIQFPYYSGAKEIDGVAWTMHTDGRLTGYGTSTKGTNYYIIHVKQKVSLKAGTYTLSFQGDKNRNLLLWDMSAGVMIARCDGSSKEVTFTLAEDSGIIQLYFNVSSENIGFNIDGYPMLNLGSTVLPYEPYGYKTPFGIHGDNLAKYWKAAYVTASGTVNANRVNGVSFPVKVESGQTVCFTNPKTNFGRGIAVFSGFDGETLTDMIYRSTNNTVTYTADSDCYIIIWGNYDNATSMDESVFALCGQMLNLGSTALPYSPYFSETVPVYLGQTPTVRRVKKVVFDGTEDWVKRDTPENSYYCKDVRSPNTSQGICTHFERYERVVNLVNGTIYFGASAISARLDSATTVAAFKSYLASQYAAGTPVTIWYVLAEPETGIVNEPLAKIGNYADELHSTDAGVSIPTVKGNNTLTVDTDLPPSSMTIVYKGR